MQKQAVLQDLKVGVLGGGQLGRMLIQEAVNLDIRLAMLDPNPNAPCSKIAEEFATGDFSQADVVKKFGKGKDVVTVEIEHVSIEGLKALEADGVKVYPQARVLEIVQDKGLQKAFFKEKGIPTAPFTLVENRRELEENLHLLPVAQKMRKGGYDGRGVSILRSSGDLGKAFDVPSVLEEFVPFEKELAVMVARNKQGEVRTFPAVELDFNPEANLVEMLFAPANMSAEIEEKAARIAIQTIEAFEMVGVLAVELFLTKDGEILVNEVAPRPHNSGHHTIEANVSSQYAQHLRSILNLPLGDTKLIRPAAMVNILGEEGYEGAVFYEGLDEVLSISGVYVHIYGKEITKPFRKMGHVTITGESPEEVKEKAFKVKSLLKAKTK
jgi:5-(carboxyamino)imidazole ribonucleotide synthase